MNIKKIFSFITSAVLMFSCTLPYVMETKSAAAVENTDPTTSMEGEPELIADSSVGSFITNAMKSEDIVEAGEQESEVQYSGDYGIEDITYDPDTNTLTLTTWQIQNCKAVVGFYSDDGKRMYTSQEVDISEGDEITAFNPENSKLPENFLVKAYLINDLLMPLCNCYVYNKMTKEMQEILAKTVDDFDPSLVVQIDETDDTNNFYVLNDNTILIDSTADVNTIVSADFETGTYVFTNIDDSMRALAAGDVFSAATDEGVIAAEIVTITIDGDTATIVGTSDEEELFQFIKIDTSEMDPSLFDGYTLDMSQADESVSLSDKSFDETPIPEDEDTDTEADEESGQAKAEQSYMAGMSEVPVGDSLKGEEQATISLKAEPTFTIAEKKKEGEVVLGGASAKVTAKVNCVLSVPIEIKAEFYWSLGYSSFELKAGYAIKVKGSATLKGELKIPLAVIDFPVAGVLHLSLTPKFVVEGSVEVSLTYQKSFSAGFKWDTNTWALNKCDGLKLKVEDKLELKLEAKVFIGLELEFSGYIISEKTCSVKFPLDIGVQVKATLPIAFLKLTDTNGIQSSEGAFLRVVEANTEEYPDTLYNCDAFVEIDVDFQVKLSAELKIADYDWNPWRNKMKLKADLFEYTTSIGKFYFVVYPDSETGQRKVEFGSWDDLKGKDFICYKTTVKVYDKDKQPLSGASLNDNDVTTDASGEVIYYLSPGLYRFNCSYNGETRNNAIRIINEKRTVTFVMGGGSSNPGDNDDPTDPGDTYTPEEQASLQYLYWNENDEGGITIDCCKSSAVEITIPREIDGKTVTSITGYAFQGCKSLTDITIPNSVTSIEDFAFSDCTSLTSITIPDSVTYIGAYAFGDCTNLESITILNPDCEIFYDSLPINNGTIYGYANSTAQAYAEKYGYNFVSIGEASAVNTAASFMPVMNAAGASDVECTFTQEVAVPDIYNFYVFADENADDILAADNLLYMTQVEVTADSLTVEIPYILDGDYPDKAEKLVRFESADSGLVFDETSEDDTVSLIDYAGSAADVAIPEQAGGKSVTSIAGGAFNGCTGIVSVTVPASVTSIGESAFADCESLSSITISNPDCEIFDSAYTICNGYDDEVGEYYFNGTICGYENSTAQQYAEKYGYNFESLGEAPAEPLLGDVDGNDVVDGRDASMVLTHYALTSTSQEGIITDAQALLNADWDRNDVIDGRDASAILTYYAEQSVQK